MIYFQQAFHDFFLELCANNHRDWFQANKSRYEQFVKKPFEKFVAAVIAEVQKEDPTVLISPSQAIFRINRDVRFSQDKSPYKLHTSAHIVPGSRKNMNAPGMYFEFTLEHIGIYGGLYMPDKVQLENIRQAIAADPKAIDVLIAEPSFKTIYGEIKGEQNVRLPKPLQEVRSQQPLVANKQFYFVSQLPPETILKENLLEILMEHYRAGQPVNRYLQKAIVFGNEV